MSSGPLPVLVSVVLLKHLDQYENTLYLDTARSLIVYLVTMSPGPVPVLVVVVVVLLMLVETSGVDVTMVGRVLARADRKSSSSRLDQKSFSRRITSRRIESKSDLDEEKVGSSQKGSRREMGTWEEDIYKANKLKRLFSEANYSNDELFVAMKKYGLA